MTWRCCGEWPVNGQAASSQSVLAVSCGVWLCASSIGLHHPDAGIHITSSSRHVYLLLRPSSRVPA